LTCQTKKKKKKKKLSLFSPKKRAAAAPKSDKPKAQPAAKAKKPEVVALKGAEDPVVIKTEPVAIKTENEGNAASEAGGEQQLQTKMMGMADLSLGLGAETGSAVRLASVKQSRDTTMGGVAKVSSSFFLSSSFPSS